MTVAIVVYTQTQ